MYIYVYKMCALHTFHFLFSGAANHHHMEWNNFYVDHQQMHKYYSPLSRVNVLLLNPIKSVTSNFTWPLGS